MAKAIKALFADGPVKVFWTLDWPRVRDICTALSVCQEDRCCRSSRIVGGSDISRESVELLRRSVKLLGCCSASACS